MAILWIVLFLFIGHQKVWWIHHHHQLFTSSENAIENHPVHSLMCMGVSENTPLLQSVGFPGNSFLDKRFIFLS